MHVLSLSFGSQQCQCQWQVIDKRRLNMEVEDKDLLLEQLRKEIEILQRLSHPNIVAFQEVSQ